VRSQLRIVPVETMDEVLAEALIDSARPATRIKAERAARQQRVGRRATRRPTKREAPIAATNKPAEVDQPAAGTA